MTGIAPANRGQLALRAALIVLAGALVYAPALRGGWIWDDYLYIAHNAAVQSLGGLRLIWLHPSGVNYFPVTFSLWWAEWRLWGASPAGFHAVNLALHLLNCLLLWRIVSRLGLRGGWVAALIFAAHPLAVESVAWISETKNTLSLALLFGSFLAILDAQATERGARARRLAYSAAFVLFTGAMLAKSTVAMFPIFLLLFAWSRKGTLARGDLIASLPFFAMAVSFGLVTIWFERHRAMPMGAPPPESMTSRWGEAIAAVVFYLEKSVMPLGLAAIYPRSSVLPPREALGLSVVVIALPAWVLARRWRGAASAGFSRQSRLATLALGWFMLNLMPTLGLVPMAYQRLAPVADHFAYLALPGLIVFAVATLARSISPLAGGYAATALTCAACLAFIGASRAQAAHFSSEPAFWTDAIRRNPESALAYNERGGWLLRQGRTAEALRDFEASVRLEPGYVEAHNNLGLADEGDGRIDAALREFQHALELRPQYFEARNNLAGLQFRLGVALARYGRLDEAIAHYREALRLDPDSPPLRVNLGNALARTGQFEAAVEQYRSALRMDPGYGPARESLSIVLGAAPNLAR